VAFTTWTILLSLCLKSMGNSKKTNRRQGIHLPRPSEQLNDPKKKKKTTKTSSRKGCQVGYKCALSNRGNIGCRSGRKRS
jgi:hypothetical protein